MYCFNYIQNPIFELKFKFYLEWVWNQAIFMSTRSHAQSCLLLSPFMYRLSTLSTRYFHKYSSFLEFKFFDEKCNPSCKPANLYFLKILVSLGGVAMLPGCLRQHCEIRSELDKWFFHRRSSAVIFNLFSFHRMFHLLPLTIDFWEAFLALTRNTFFVHL